MLLLCAAGCGSPSASPRDLSVPPDLSAGCTPSPTPSGAGCYAVQMNCADDGIACDGTTCTCHSGPTILSTFPQTASTCTSGFAAAWTASCGFPQ